MMATQIHDQYEYAIQQDMNLGRYEAARQRLEYILSKDPEYPGAKEKLLEVEKCSKLLQRHKTRLSCQYYSSRLLCVLLWHLKII